MAHQRILDGVGQPVEPQQALGFVLFALNVLVCLDLPTLQKMLRRAEKVLQELAFPGVPHLGARAADVRDSEEIERDQPPFGANDAGEAPHDLRIGQVLLLRYRRHREMVLDEELDELHVFGRKAVLAAETPGLEPAPLRVIAPAAFGDVVEYRGDVQRPVARAAGEVAGAQWIFVRELAHSEAARDTPDRGEALVPMDELESIV